MSLLTETQKAFVAGKKWSLDLHLNCEDCGVIQKSCKSLGIFMVTVTPKEKGLWGYGKTHYMRDGDDKEYETLPDLLVAMGVK